MGGNSKRSCGNSKRNCGNTMHAKGIIFRPKSLLLELPQLLIFNSVYGQVYIVSISYQRYIAIIYNIAMESECA